MVNDNLRKKLVKLQALIDDAQNEAEGEAALLAFQRLLVSHGLERDELDLGESTPSREVIRVSSGIAPRWWDWEKNLHAVIAAHFRCLSLNRRQFDANATAKIHYRYVKYQYEYLFVGFADDAEIAESTFRAARETAIQCWERYLVTHLDSTLQDRNNFCYGFSSGLDIALSRQESEQNFALVIVRDPEVDRSIEHARHVQIDQPKSSHSSAFSHGRENGEQFGSQTILC